MMLLLPLSDLHAEISRIDTFRVIGYTQTGDGESLDLQGAFFTTAVIATVDNEFSSITMTYPGIDSPVNLNLDTPTIYRYYSPFVVDFPTLDAAYPPGIYSYEATGGFGDDLATVEYSGTYFPDTRPYLDGANYSDLQGMNAANSFFFDFSLFQPNDESSEAFLFFAIVDLTDSSIVFSENFLPSDTDGITVPGGTLLPNHSYRYRLVYSGRFNAPGTGALFQPLNAFDYYTEGTFSTAVPEASTILLTGIALLTGALAHRTRKVC